MRARVATLLALVALVALFAAPANAGATRHHSKRRAAVAHKAHHHARSRKAGARESHRLVARSDVARHRRPAHRRPAPKPTPPAPPVTLPVPPAAPASTTCKGTDTVPDAAGVPQAAAAALCLVNRERAAAGEPALAASPQLGAAAAAHSADMVAAHYFSHDSLDGRTLVDRIKAAGWTTTGRWRAGENIAWGSGSYGTPRHIVESWMNSPGHRANILNAVYREAGSGVAAGTPDRTSMAGATYTMDFGTHG